MVNHFAKMIPDAAGNDVFLYVIAYVNKITTVKISNWFVLRNSTS